MLYQESINFKNYNVVFQYEPTEKGPSLANWTAYSDEQEVMIPCRDESESIEKEIKKFIEKEFKEIHAQ